MYLCIGVLCVRTVPRMYLCIVVYAGVICDNERKTSVHLFHNNDSGHRDCGDNLVA